MNIAHKQSGEMRTFLLRLKLTMLHINTKHLIIYVLLCPITALVHPLISASDAKNITQKPNIVIILADDLGWDDVSYHGSDISTPNIDNLVSEGIELNRFYAQPTCSPSRAALMTGKSPKRLGISRALTKNQKIGLSLGEKILPQYLGEVGYRSVMVGKWHLGGYTPAYAPLKRGFEHFYGYLHGGIGYWDHNHGGGRDWQRNGQTIRENGYSTELLGNEAIRLIEQHDANYPLFLYLAFGAPHLPNEAPIKQIANYEHIANQNRRIHAAMVAELDQQVGRVISALKENNMANNTLILFTSDNGGLVSKDKNMASIFRRLAPVATFLFGRPIPITSLEGIASMFYDGGSSNYPLRGGKISALEGGVRVPGALWWPSQLSSKRYNNFMTLSDVLPTLLEAVGGYEKIEDNIDGVSHWPSIFHDKKVISPPYIVTGFEKTALYQPPWKLIIGDEINLYNVYDDPEESYNLATQMSQRVENMKKMIDEWPAGDERGVDFFKFFQDPDSFGGTEDRIPWAEFAIENLEK
ncbi:MAG: hypothetical protein CBC09_03970 [Cellvibrionales bacterium TMED49]|nr:hypothetical protein [Porticoccaceae bacterium]OUU38975.1 MAG: hypothetical protein CBC09_03970 [Cellvibrionales bacterium TMED49]